MNPIHFYVHHEAEPEYTLAIAWHEADARPASELIKQFASAFCVANPTAPPLTAAEVLLKDADGLTVAPSACVIHHVSRGADLFAERAPAAAAAAAAVKASAAGKQAAAAPAGNELAKLLTPYMKAAEEAWEKRSYKRARSIYAEVVATVEQTSGLESALAHTVLALRRLGEIEALCHVSPPAHSQTGRFPPPVRC